ncbi:hypothetical protein LINPERHAP1_LOCUS14779 [Linum perenne]
MMTLGR